MRRYGAAALLGCGLACAPLPAAACPGADDPCLVAGGRYLALPPPGWDGRAPLPATIFFHGWRSSASAFAQDEAFTRVFGAEGVLLVLPDGVNGTWAHQGSPSTARDELAFMDAVRADVLARWPVDPGRLLATGFSQGGSMVWDLACRRGRDYRAFAAIAGAFWEPLPENCDGGPVDLLHVHGTADPVVPMGGRWIRSTWKQGDVRAGLAILARTDGCRDEPERADLPGLRCERWDGCGSGRELRLCLHDGGHLMPEGWVRLVHDWMRGLDQEERGG
jgi:polyhydroxybutyrate depolymerase